MSHSIQGTVAFVTGANRGIGAALVNALVARGARKVYAAARRRESLDSLTTRLGPVVVPIVLDVTDAEEIRCAAEAAPDVRLLVNNAGVAAFAFKSALDPRYLTALEKELAVNVSGLYATTIAFAPALTSSPGSALVNVLSASALTNFPTFPSYSASKAAAHSLTQALRLALRPSGVSVHGVYPGPVDTDMAKSLPMDKEAPSVVAENILDGIEAGIEEILPDPTAAQVGAAYEAGPKALERWVAEMPR